MQNDMWHELCREKLCKFCLLNNCLAIALQCLLDSTLHFSLVFLFDNLIKSIILDQLSDYIIVNNSQGLDDN